MSIANVIFGTQIVTTPFQSDVNANNHRITNLAAGINANDAATVSQVAAGFMENPAIEDLSMTGFNITQLGDGVDLSDAVNYGQLSNWAYFGATSNITFSGNSSNVYEILGSGAISRGEPTVDAHLSGLRIYAKSPQSGAEVLVSYKDASNVIQFYDSLKGGQAGVAPSQNTCVYEFKSGGMGANNYSYAVRGSDGLFTIGVGSSLDSSKLDAVTANAPVEAFTTRHQVNNILQSQGCAGTLQNVNFFPRMLNIPNEFRYVPQMRSVNFARGGDRYYNGSKGEKLWLRGARGYLVLPKNENQIISSDLFTDPSGFTCYCRMIWPGAQSIGSFPNFFRFSESDNSSTDICNVGIFQNRVNVGIASSSSPFPLSASIELTSGSPAEASYISSTLTGTDLNTIRGQPWNIFLRYDGSANFFVSLLLDDLQPIQLSTGVTEGLLAGIATRAQLSNFDVKSLILGASINTDNSQSAATYQQFAFFQNNLSSLTDRQAVVTACRALYQPTDAVILKNVARVTQLVAPVQSANHNFRTRADGIRPLSGNGMTISVSNEFFTTELGNVVLPGGQYDYFNRGNGVATFDFTTSNSGFTVVGGSNIAGNSWGQLMFADASRVMVINPIQDGATNKEWSMGSNCTLSGFNVIDCSQVIARDLIIDTTGFVNPALTIRGLGIAGNSIRFQQIASATTQTNGEIVWGTDTSGYASLLSWIGWNVRLGTGNSRGALYMGSSGAENATTSFGNILAGRNSQDYFNVGNDFLCLGGGARGVAILRADLSNGSPNMHIDASGRVLRTGAPSFYSFYRTSNYSQALTNSLASQIAFTPESSDFCGNGFTYFLSAIENVGVARIAQISCNLSVSTPSANSVIIFIRIGSVDVARQIIDSDNEIRHISLQCISNLQVGSVISIRGQVATNATVTFHNVQWTVHELR